MGLGASGGLFFLLRHVENGLVAGRDVMPRWLYQGHLGAFWGFPAPEFTSTDYFPILPWIFLYESGYFLFFIRRRQARPHALSRAVPVLGWMGRRSFGFICCTAAPFRGAAGGRAAGVKETGQPNHQAGGPEWFGCFSRCPLSKLHIRGKGLTPQGAPHFVDVGKRVKVFIIMVVKSPFGRHGVDAVLLR